MKVRSNERNLVSRRWRNNSRIRNHHLGCGWLRRATTNNPEERGSKSHALRHDPFSTNSSELGSVTAEFALILPAVLLILVFSLSVLALQANRMALIELAAEGARAIARGETEEVLKSLIQDRALTPPPQTKLEYESLSICLVLSQNVKLPILGNFLDFPVLERQCARKSGL